MRSIDLQFIDRACSPVKRHRCFRITIIFYSDGRSFSRCTPTKKTASRTLSSNSKRTIGHTVVGRIGYGDGYTFNRFICTGSCKDSCIIYIGSIGHNIVIECHKRRVSFYKRLTLALGNETIGQCIFQITCQTDDFTRSIIQGQLVHGRTQRRNFFCGYIGCANIPIQNLIHDILEVFNHRIGFFCHNRFLCFGYCLFNHLVGMVMGFLVGCQYGDRHERNDHEHSHKEGQTAFHFHRKHNIPPLFFISLWDMIFFPAPSDEGAGELARLRERIYLSLLPPQAVPLPHQRKARLWL